MIGFRVILLVILLSQYPNLAAKSLLYPLFYIPVKSAATASISDANVAKAQDLKILSRLERETNNIGVNLRQVGVFFFVLIPPKKIGNLQDPLFMAMEISKSLWMDSSPVLVPPDGLLPVMP